MTLPWRRFLIPVPVLQETERILRSFNRPDSPREGFAYWAGRKAGQDCVALTAYRPECVATPGSVDIDEAANARFVRWLRRNELTHVGQVHSHPPGIDHHSQGDDLWAFMKYPGLLSVVVPNYAKEGMRPIEKCGIHVFDGDEFLQLSRDEARQKLLVIPVRAVD